MYLRPVRFIALGLFSGFMLLEAQQVFARDSITMQQIKAIIARHLSGYGAGDLIARDNIEPIFNELIELGVNPVDDQEELYDSFLPEGSFLVRTLRSPAGIKFMRHVCEIPGAYDRLERLSWLPEGRPLIQELISAEDGAEQFKNMCDPKIKFLVLERLGEDPRAKNFDLPTGHMHTAEELTQRLEIILSRRSSR